MATEVERLVTLLEARITGYERELKKASQQADREARNIERRFNKMNDTLGRQFAASAQAIGGGIGKINGLLGALGAGVSISAIVGLGRASLQLADDLQDTSEQLGVSTRALQVYRFGAAEAGIEAGKMDQAILKLSTTIGEAAAGDEAAQKKFRALGISFEDGEKKARSAEAVLADLADLIQSLPTPAERAAAAAVLLGERAGPRLAALLSQGAEGLRKLEKAADDAGQIMSDETIQRLAAAQRAIEKFTTWLEIQAGETIGFFDALLEKQRQIDSQFDLGKTVEQIDDLSKTVRNLRDQIATAPADIVPMLKEQLAADERELNRLLELRNRLVRNLPGQPQGHAGKGIAFAPKPQVGSLDLGESDDGDDDKRFDQLLRELELMGKQREATAQRLADEQFGIDQQKLKLQGLEREAEIEAAIREARKADPNITDAEIERLRMLVGQRYDLLRTLSDEEQQKKNIEDADKRLNDLLALRGALQEQLNVFVAQGNTEKIKETEAVLAGVNTQIATAIESFIAYWQVVGGPEAEAAIAKLQALKLGLENTGQTAAITGQQINNMLASGMTDAFDQFARSIAEGDNAVQSLGQAFAQFAADFLRQIALMIIQQAILLALQTATGTVGSGGAGPGAGPGSEASGGGGIGGFIATAIGSLFHGGGIAGQSGGARRRVPATAFRGAPRLHDGNVPGLKSDEVAAILQKGEPVISLPQLRKARQSAAAPSAGAAPEVALKVVNAFDSGSVLSEALGTPIGEKSFVNFVRRNSGALKSALNINGSRP